MGTLFSTGKMHPAYESSDTGRERQVEIYRPSGEFHLTLRIGEIGEEDAGRGSEVMLDEEGAREVLHGLLAGMGYLGFRTDDMI